MDVEENLLRLEVFVTTSKTTTAIPRFTRDRCSLVPTTLTSNNNHNKRKDKGNAALVTTHEMQRQQKQQ